MIDLWQWMVEVDKELHADKRGTLAVVDIDDTHDKLSTLADDAKIRWLYEAFAAVLLELNPFAAALSTQVGRDAWAFYWPQQAYLDLLPRVYAAQAEWRGRLFEVPGGVSLSFTFSAGIIDIGVADRDSFSILRQADESLRHAKRLGKDRCAVGDPNRMVMKSSYYTMGELERLHVLSERSGFSESELLRRALDTLLYASDLGPYNAARVPLALQFVEQSAGHAKDVNPENERLLGEKERRA